MKWTVLPFLVTMSILGGTQARAEGDNDAEVHRLKAQTLIGEKNWTRAESEAKAVTELAPQDADGWLMFGIVEQRLEKNENAAAAYKKYLSMNPPADKAAAVKQKLAEVEIRHEKQTEETMKENEGVYGPRSNGVFLTFAPLYRPATSTQMDGNISNNYQLGFELSHVYIGYMTTSGTMQDFKALPVNTTSGTYATLGPATLKIQELFIDFNFTLNEPFQNYGPFSFFIPLHMGVLENNLKLNDGSRNFSNIATDFAVGGGVQWYTRTPFSLSLSGLAHYAFVLSDLEENSTSAPIQTKGGSNILGGDSCFEVRLTLTYLFGHEKSLTEKALAQ